MSEIKTLTAGDAASSVAAAQQANTVSKAKELAGRAVKSEKQIDKAVGGFEALMLHEMLKSMWATVETTGLLGEDSNQAQIYRDMLNQALADSVAEGRGIGMKEIVKREILKQEGASKK